MPARGVHSKEFKQKTKVLVYLPDWIVKRMRLTLENQSRFIENMFTENLNWKEEDTYEPR